MLWVHALHVLYPSTAQITWTVMWTGCTVLTIFVLPCVTTVPHQWIPYYITCTFQTPGKILVIPLTLRLSERRKNPQQQRQVSFPMCLENAGCWFLWVFNRLGRQAGKQAGGGGGRVSREGAPRFYTGCQWLTRLEPVTLSAASAATTVQVIPCTRVSREASFTATFNKLQMWAQQSSDTFTRETIAVRTLIVNTDSHMYHILTDMSTCPL